MTTYWGDSKSIPPPKALPFKESLLVLGKLLSDPGSDIMMGQDINMRDSISMKTLSQPCRALGCKHIQCFDFEAYLHINKSRPSSEYSCPICNQVSNPSKIYIDTIFLCLLKLLPENSNISIMKDGQFDIRVNKPQREIIVVDDDDDEGENFVAMSTCPSSNIVQCTGSVVELSYIVPFTASKSKKNLTSLVELTTASLDDVLHLMNVENAWGVNSIPGSTIELQKCIRAKRPFASTTNDGLKYLLQQVDGVGSIRAGKILDHFYKILQSKLSSYLEFIEARSLFKENALNLSLSSPIVIEFLKKNGRLKPISEPLPNAVGSASKAKKKATKEQDVVPVVSHVVPASSPCGAASSSRKRSNSVISVASSNYESELESAVVVSTSSHCSGSSSSSTAAQSVNADSIRHSQSAAAMRAKSSSAICGEGIANVAVLPKLTRRQSSGSIAQDSEGQQLGSHSGIIDLSDGHGEDIEDLSPTKRTRPRKSHKRQRTDDYCNPSGEFSPQSGSSSSMEEAVDADVVTVSSASVQPVTSRSRRRRVGVVDVDADDDIQLRSHSFSPSSACTATTTAVSNAALSCAATVSSTSSAEVSVPARVTMVIAASASMSRAAPPMQEPGAPSMSSDSLARRRPPSSSVSNSTPDPGPAADPSSNATAVSSNQQRQASERQISSPSSARPRPFAAAMATTGVASPLGRSRSNSVLTTGSGNSHIRFQEDPPAQPTTPRVPAAPDANPRISSANAGSGQAPAVRTAPVPKAAFPKQAASSISPLIVALAPSNAAPQAPQQRYELVPANASNNSSNNPSNSSANRRVFAPRVPQPQPIVIPSIRAASPPPRPPPRPSATTSRPATQEGMAAGSANALSANAARSQSPVRSRTQGDRTATSPPGQSVFVGNGRTNDAPVIQNAPRGERNVAPRSPNMRSPQRDGQRLAPGRQNAAPPEHRAPTGYASVSVQGTFRRSDPSTQPAARSTSNSDPQRDPAPSQRPVAMNTAALTFPVRGSTSGDMRESQAPPSGKILYPNRSWVRPEMRSEAAERAPRSNDSRGDSREPYPDRSGWSSRHTAAPDYRDRPYDRDGRDYNRRSEYDSTERSARTRSRSRERDGNNGSSRDRSSGWSEPRRNDERPDKVLPMHETAVGDPSVQGYHNKEYIRDHHKYPVRSGTGYYASLENPKPSQYRTEREMYPRYHSNKYWRQSDSAPAAFTASSEAPSVSAPHAASSAQAPPPPPPSQAHKRAASPGVVTVQAAETGASAPPNPLAIVPPPPPVPDIVRRAAQSPQARQPRPTTTDTSKDTSKDSGRRSSTEPRAATSGAASLKAISVPATQTAAALPKPKHMRFDDAASVPAQATATAPGTAAASGPTSNTHVGVSTAAGVGASVPLPSAAAAPTGKGRAKTNSKLDTSAVPTRPGNELIHPRITRRERDSAGGEGDAVDQRGQAQPGQQQSFAGLMTRHFSNNDGF